MPLFVNKFEPKPAPIRSLRCNHCPVIKEELNDFSNISMKLENCEVNFNEGTWTISANEAHENIRKLKKRLKMVEENNNLNKIKIEVLLDLLAENICEKESAEK